MNETQGQLEKMQTLIAGKQTENSRLEKEIQEQRHKVAELEAKVKNEYSDKNAQDNIL